MIMKGRKHIIYLRCWEILCSEGVQEKSVSHVGKSFANPHHVQLEDGSLSKVGSYHGAGYEKGFEFDHYA